MSSPDTLISNKDSSDIVRAPEKSLILGIPSDASSPLVTPEIQASEVKTYMEEVLKTPTEEEPSKQEERTDEMPPSTEGSKILKVDPKPNVIEESEQSPVSPEILASEVKIYIEEELKTPTEEKQQPSIPEVPKSETKMLTEEIEPKPMEPAEIKEGTLVIEENETTDIPTSIEETEQKTSEQVTPIIEEDKTVSISTSTEENEQTAQAIDENKTTAVPTSREETEQKPTESIEETTEAISEENSSDIPTTAEIESKPSDQATPAVEEDKTIAITTSIEETESMPTKSNEPTISPVQDGPTNWDDLGIKFVIIPITRYNDIVKFVYEHFYPDEPITRSTGICQPGGPGNKMMDKFYVKDALKHGVSMMATDKDDKIVAIRIGKVVRRSQGQTFKKDDALLKVTSWVKRFLPKEYSQFFLLQKLFDRMNYDVTKAFDQLKCDVLYEDSLLATAKDCRLKGLGTDLVRRSFEIASGAGCEYIYTIATGEYSAKIFSKLDFTLDHEHLYEELKDKNGNPMLNDTREHTKARIFYKKIKSDSSE